MCVVVLGTVMGSARPAVLLGETTRVARCLVLMTGRPPGWTRPWTVFRTAPSGLTSGLDDVRLVCMSWAELCSGVLAAACAAVEKRKG